MAELPTLLLSLLFPTFPVLAPTAGGAAHTERATPSRIVSLWLPDDEPDPRAERARLEELLDDPEPEARARGVRGLARLGERGDWERVLAALADRDGRVGDAAQKALGDLTEPRVLERLLGADGLGSKEPEVRERAAEVVGRLGVPVEADDLARALDTREPLACRALLHACERRALAEGLVGERTRLVRKVEACLARRLDPHLRASALAALVALDPARGLAESRAALGDRAGEVRGAGLRGLLAAHRVQGLGDAAVEREAVRLLGDEDGAVRWVATEVLASIGTREGLRALALRLGVEERERLRRRLVDALQLRTGLRHRQDPRPWLAALDALPADWRAPRAGRAARGVDDGGGGGRPGAPRPGATAAARPRLPVRSDRVVFLVDLSGSIWNDRGDGRTRKDSLDVVVHATLESLPDGTRFDLVPYTGSPRPWQGNLVRADRRTRPEARAWYDGQRISGPGDFLEAVEAVLGDPEVDTICVLTDGAPTGGRRWDLALLIPYLLERTRHRPITFDVVLVDATGGMRRRWSALTEPTGGVLEGVELARIDPPAEGRGGR